AVREQIGVLVPGIAAVDAGSAVRVEPQLAGAVHEGRGSRRWLLPPGGAVVGRQQHLEVHRARVIQSEDDVGLGGGSYVQRHGRDVHVGRRGVGLRERLQHCNRQPGDRQRDKGYTRSWAQHFRTSSVARRRIPAALGQRAIGGYFRTSACTKAAAL